jgi:MFS family permease
MHREAPSGLTKQQIRKSLRASTADCVGASITIGLTQNYVTPFALSMGATTQQIGYLSSIPSFANMLIMLFAPMISERVGSRKAFILPAVLIIALWWLPILAIPYFLHTNQVWWLIALFTLCTAATGIVGPPWSSMMADLTPPEVRGSYFGLRSRIGGFTTLVFSFAAAGLLQLFTGDTRLAFTIIFLGAMCGRLISLYFLSLMSEPHPTLPPNTARESIIQILKKLFSTNIGRFILFIIFLNMAQNIDAPFFSPYLLKELQVSYISYQLINATMAVVTMFVVVWWGKRADKAGRIKVLHITALMIPFVSLLWLVNSSVVWFCTVQVYSGFAWAGFNLCAGMFIWDAAPQQNRTRYIALFGALGALGVTLGSLIGGNLGPHLPKISGSYFLTLFLVAGIVKLLVVLGLFRNIAEVRSVQQIKASELLFGDLHSAALINWWRKITNQPHQ